MIAYYIHSRPTNINHQAFSLYPSVPSNNAAVTICSDIQQRNHKEQRFHNMRANHTHQHRQAIKLTDTNKHFIQIQPHDTKNNNLQSSVCSGCNALFSMSNKIISSMHLSNTIRNKIGMSSAYHRQAVVLQTQTSK